MTSGVEELKGADLFLNRNLGRFLAHLCICVRITFGLSVCLSGRGGGGSELSLKIKVEKNVVKL